MYDAHYFPNQSCDHYAIQSENTIQDHKTIAFIRDRNHLTLEITDQISALFLHTLSRMLMDIQ
ncbi:hypothetical protein F190043G2_16380 [Blautia caecimuris]